MPPPLIKPDSADYVFAVYMLLTTALVTAGNIATLRFYARVRKSRPGVSGLLLRHISLVATGTNGLVLMVAVGACAQLGWIDTPRWLRFAGYSLFETIIVVAVFVIAVSSYRRVRGSASVTRVIEERETDVHDEHHHS